MSERLKKIEMKIKDIQRELASIRDMRPGSLNRQNRKSHDGSGGYYQLSYTHAMKSRTDYVSREEVSDIRRQTAEYGRFKKLVSAWVKLSIEHSRLKMQEKASKEKIVGIASSHQAVREVVIKITLCDTNPPIWRRLRASSTMTLDQLHYAIQGSFGWQNSHLHAFSINARERFSSNQVSLEEGDVKDSRRTTLGDLLDRKIKRFAYEYDFGDSWIHEIQVEKSASPEKRLAIPECIDGAMHCPPEDCGGIPGFEDFLEAMKDKDHEQHSELKRWYGGRFDPNKFNLSAANKGIKSYQKYCD